MPRVLETTATARCYWEPQQIRNLGITELLVFAQHQDLALGILQLLDRAANPQRIIYALSTASGTAGGFRFSLRRSAASSFQRDAIQIGPDQGARLIARGGANHSQESFLRQIVGAFLAFQTPPEETVEPVPVTREQLLKRPRDPPWNSSIKASSLIIVDRI